VHDVLSTEFRDDYEDAIQVLVGKTTAVTSLLHSLLSEKKRPGGPPGATSIGHSNLKYAWRKKKIDNAIVELERWLDIAENYYFLLFRVPHPAIDSRLQHHDSARIRNTIPSTQLVRDDFNEELPSPSSELKTFPGLDTAQQYPVPLCDSTLAYLAGNSSLLVIDRVDCPAELTDEMVETTMQNICRISQKLHHKNAIGYGLLDCKCIHPEGRINGRWRTFSFVFGFPVGFERPTSLRARLLDKKPLRSLSHRFMVARDIAKAVSYVHTFGFVHKNIRPETILMADCCAVNRGPGPPSAFLVGYGNVRAEFGKTYCRGDNNWERNLYRHGRRRGERPSEKYIMQHDIYSLGVCLLEVGLWESLILYEGSCGAERPRPSSLLNEPSDSESMIGRDGIEEPLLHLARSALPRQMGTSYAEIVEACLTCMEPNNEAFGNPDVQSADGTVIGGRFIQSVSRRVFESVVANIANPKTHQGFTTIDRNYRLVLQKVFDARPSPTTPSTRHGPQPSRNSPFLGISSTSASAPLSFLRISS